MVAACCSAAGSTFIDSGTADSLEGIVSRKTVTDCCCTLKVLLMAAFHKRSRAHSGASPSLSRPLQMWGYALSLIEHLFRDLHWRQPLLSLLLNTSPHSVDFGLKFLVPFPPAPASAGPPMLGVAPLSEGFCLDGLPSNDVAIRCFYRVPKLAGRGQANT
jgi:hypothetical protein